jgi:hypothetical protein
MVERLDDISILIEAVGAPGIDGVTAAKYATGAGAG